MAGTRDLRSVDGIWWVLTVASVLPFWSAGLLALTDWPHHLASAAVALAYEDPARHLSDFYVLNLSPRPYLGLTYLLVGLGRVMPLAWAGKVVLTLYGLSWCVAVRSLVRAGRGRDPRLAWFGPLFVHSWALAYGFVPFVSALPPAIFAVAQLRRLVDRSSPWGWALLLLSYGVSALMHPLGVAVAVIASLGLLTAPEVTARVRLSWAGLVGSVGLWALWSAQQASLPAVRFMDAGIETAWRWTIKHRLVDFALAYLPGNLEYGLALVGLGALVAAIVQGRRAPVAPPDPLERAAWALVLVYALAPVNLAVFSLRMSLLAPRLIAPMWVFCLPLARGKSPRLCAAGAVAGLLYGGLITHTHRGFDATWGAQVATIVDRVPDGATVLPQVVLPKDSALNARTVRPPEAALHAYVLMAHAGFDPLLFSTPQGPVQVRAQAPSLEASYDAIWVQSSTTVRLDLAR